MQNLVLLSLLLFLSTPSLGTSPKELLSTWTSWKSLYNRSYSFKEEPTRFAIFKSNLEMITQFNKENETPQLSLNKFADLTNEEFSTLYSNCAFSEDNEDFINKNTLSTSDLSLSELPTSVDWRMKGAINSVKDQKHCGSCWAFSVVDALESFLFLKNGYLQTFSKQQLVDCDLENMGCSGGLLSKALQYTAKYGLETEENYPYDADDTPCKYSKVKATSANNNFRFISSCNINALKAAVAIMPVPVLIQADQEIFRFYKSGVIIEGCNAKVNHAALIIGYKMINGEEAFIVKNSWGLDWGEEGYVYISTNSMTNLDKGVCGILSQAIIPTN